MSNIYTDGDFTIALPASLALFTAPFAGVNIDYVLTQDYMQFLANYVPLALNTPHPTYATFLLASEGPRTDMGGGVVRWTRTYAKVPAAYDQPTSIAYNLIGYVTLSETAAGIGRARRNAVVSARQHFEYFLADKTSGKIIDVNGVAVYTGAAGTLPSLSSLPSIREQRYYNNYPGGVVSESTAEFIAHAQTETNPQLVYPVPNGTALQPPLDAYPTRGIYEAWIAKTATVKTYNASTNVLTDTGDYQIAAQASLCRRWMGNILERMTVYMFPQ